MADSSTLDMVDSAVRAGGVNRIALYPGYAPGLKSLLPFLDSPSLGWKSCALRNSGGVRRIAVVGPEEELSSAAGPHAEFVPGADSLRSSVLAGLGHFRDSPLVLFVMAYLPLLSPEAVREFLDDCAAAPASLGDRLYISAVPRAAFTGRYAHSTKPFNRFSDAEVCHGNLIAATPSLVANELAAERVNRLYAARKSPIRSGLALGWQAGFAYGVGVELLHAIKLSRMAAVASRQIGLNVVRVLINRPEITIDEPADYAFVHVALESNTPYPAVGMLYSFRAGEMSSS